MPQLRALGDTIFAMHRPALEQLLTTIEARRVEPPTLREENPAVARQDAEPVEGAGRAYRVENVGVLPVHGGVRPRGPEFGWLFGYGGCVLEHAARDLTALLEDRRVEAIVLDVSSPGGMVEGVQAFAELVARAGERKPIEAYASGMAASAAYWIPAATRRLVMNPTAEAGSIGVIATYLDWSKYDERLGVEEIEFVSSQSPNKRPDPKSEAGAALIQRRVDDLAEIFVEAVAGFRGVSRDDVIARFGAGDVMVGRRAVEAGLADDVGSFDEMLSELSRANRRPGMALSENAMKQLKASLEAASVDELREASPALVQKIEDAAHAAGKEAGKAAAEAAVAAELERQEGIRSIQVQGSEELIEKGLKDRSATKESVALEILSAQKAGTLKVGAQIAQEAPDAVPGMGGEPGADAEEQAALKAMRAAAESVNASRGNAAAQA